MKNENGITLISLVMTIVLIFILASIGTYTGFESYENMRVQAFVAKMKTIQEAVNNLCEKYSVSEINEMGFAFDSSSIPSDQKNILNTVISDGTAGKLKSWFSSGGDDSTINYRYFTIEQISTILGIKDFDTPIFFNPKTKNVIATDGIKYEGTMYYRQYDLSGGETLSEPVVDTDYNLTPYISVQTYNNLGVIKIDSDFTFKEIVYYKKENETYNQIGYSQDRDKVTVNESGTYKIEATTIDGTTKTAEDIEVVIVNKPLLVDGMVPVIMSNGSSYTQMTDDDVKTESDNYKNWYNYAQNEKKWANAKLSDGSIYVWIPRYAYFINGNKIEVEFMKDNSSLITTAGKALASNYRVIPAFADGSTTGFTNGEWDSEISGIWVAKYETTAQTISGTSHQFPKNFSTHVQSWTNLTPKNMFDYCREMESLTATTYFKNTLTRASGANTYGVFVTDTNNIDTHLMKNSEWGTVSYLTYSKYGRGGIPAKAQNYYVDSYVANDYSSTNNMYGIYGLSGGAPEVVSAGYNIQNSFNSENQSTKYATVYASGKNIFGDAVNETKGWNSCASETVTNIFMRGGTNANANAGMFAYQEKKADTTGNASFRPVLIINY